MDKNFYSNILAQIHSRANRVFHYGWWNETFA